MCIHCMCQTAVDKSIDNTVVHFFQIGIFQIQQFKHREGFFLSCFPNYKK